MRMLFARPARSRRPWLRLALGTWVAVLALWMASTPGLAQDAKATREREQLRRMQAALKQAQAQQEALVSEKASLEQQNKQARDALDQANAQVRAGGAEAQRLRGEAARLRTEGERSRQALAAEQERAQQLQGQLEQVRAQLQQSQQAGEALRQQVQSARREVGERTQLNSVLTALLERSTQALAKAEESNRQMHAAASLAIQRYRSKSEADLRAQNEPFLGLQAVEIENVAEGLRAELDKHRLATTPR